MAVVSQFSVIAKNERGALAEICSKLAEKAVNILGLMAPAQPGKAPLRLVVNNSEAARKVLASLELSFVEEPVLEVRLSDRPGALGKLTRKLAEHQIDIQYAYGTILKGAGKASVILAVSDVNRAARLVN